MANDQTVSVTLQSWHMQLEKIRQVQRSNGDLKPVLASLGDDKGMSGLEVMTALLNGQFPPAHMADTFDCELVQVGDGFSVFQATPQLKHYNPLGTYMAVGTPRYWTLSWAAPYKLSCQLARVTPQLNSTSTS